MFVYLLFDGIIGRICSGHRRRFECYKRSALQLSYYGLLFGLCAVWCVYTFIVERLRWGFSTLSTYLHGVRAAVFCPRTFAERNNIRISIGNTIFVLFDWDGDARAQLWSVICAENV